MSHVMHKEKAKKMIIDLMKDSKNKRVFTDQQVEQRVDDILMHMYKFILKKLQYSGSLDDLSNEKRQGPVSTSDKSNSQGPQI